MSDLLPRIEHRHLGVLSYSKALTMQKELHQKVVASGGYGVILTLQHPRVLTLGNRAQREFIIKDAGYLLEHNIQVEETDRGGEVTAHDLGQLVVYPILSQRLFSLSPKKYVHLMEESVISLLEDYGISAHRDKEHPGVWVAQGKICAIGVRIKQRVSMHGLALNICNDVGLFETIVPCGIKDRSVTSMSLVLGRQVDVDEVMEKLLVQFSRHFAVNIGS